LTEQIPALDATPLACDVYLPARDAPRAALIWLAGWSDHRTRWHRPAERLRDAGLAVYVLDQRGQGDSGGPRGYLSRFSQLLSDLQAVRRIVRRRHATPQVLLGHSFGGLVVLRYLEMQPSDPVAAAVLSSPWLATAAPIPVGKRLLGRLLADLWPTLRVPDGLDPAGLCRDPAVVAAFAADPAAHHVMTPGAWREIQWAQGAVPADAARLDVPLLFLLGGADPIADAHVARAFATSLSGEVRVRWYEAMYHELLLDPEWEGVVEDVEEFLGGML
jgi:alpha-beta hydrolase superfamily lysophospholipase